ncbi:protein SidH (plasmid) [Legionella adelaidensis]|uniref:Protein SidH n=1 Tax=Legionella adelaidensis TaxID=45056 RepID=A0A0W0R4G4_9GAMM|nr:hypothetical protein [Legionella adelaidensis]KTC65922.1 protein SidH [Legionella adelaidensis]VEH85542.1 protein SidH [Legionella adelaidensis]
MVKKGLLGTVKDATLAAGAYTAATAGKVGTYTAALAGVTFARRPIEEFFLYLKEDVQVVKTFSKIQKDLLSLLQNSDYINPELSKYFTNPAFPLEIKDEDPSQVAGIKKILNAIHYTVSAMEKVEKLDIRHDRYGIAMAADLTQTLWSGAIHELSNTILLLNQADEDVYSLFGPAINTLLSVYSDVVDKFNSSTKKPESADVAQEAAADIEVTGFEAWGKGLGGLVGKLPVYRKEENPVQNGLENISHLVTHLPHYFEKLQEMIALGASDIPVKSTTSAQEYQALMLERANKAKRFLDGVTSQTSFSQLGSYFSVLKLLVDQSADLLNTGAPLTKQAYHDAVDKLNYFRHTLLPRMIAEVEKIEEELFLKPGLLTAPMLEQMDAYYRQLATNVNQIAETAGVLDTTAEVMDYRMVKLARFLLGSTSGKVETGPRIKPIENLNVMQDATFIAAVKAARMQRYHQVALKQEDNTEIEAAQNFFTKLESYGSVYQLRCKWSLANLYPEDKAFLLNEYKKFQGTFAKDFPEIDEIIVNALQHRNEGGLLARVTNSAYKQLWSSNQFTTVNACKERVFTRLQQQKNQNEFAAAVIATGDRMRDEQQYAALGQKTVLEKDITAYAYPVSMFEPNKSASEYRNTQLEIVSNLDQLNQAKEELEAFYTYLKDKYPHENPVIHQLSAEDKEFLRRSYKIFRPHLIALNEQLDLDLTNALSDDPQTSTMRVSDILFAKRALEDKISAHQGKAVQDLTFFKDRANEAQVQEITAREIQPLGGKANKNHLFGRLAELKISKKVDTYLHTTLKNYLKENIDPEVFKKLSFDETDLPANYTFDSKEVQHYKKIINAFFHLKRGLERAEKIAEGETSLSRMFLLKEVALTWLNDLTRVKYYLLNMANDPVLQAVLGEANTVLAPLNSMPVISGFLQSREKQPQVPDTDFDMVAAWRHHQDISIKVLGDINEPRGALDDFFTLGEHEDSEYSDVETAVEEEAPTVSTSSVPVQLEASETPKLTSQQYIQKLAEQLYGIPNKLRQLNTGTPLASEEALQAKIDQLVKNLSGGSFGTLQLLSPAFLERLLNAGIEINEQLATAGKEGRLLVLNNVSANIGADLLKAADNIEYMLGLKLSTYSEEFGPAEMESGKKKNLTLSDSLEKSFNEFFKTLVLNLPFEKDQKSLELIVSSDLTQARLENEKQRLIKEQANNESEQLSAFFFGERYENFDEIDELYEDLERLYESESLLDVKDEINEIYKKLQPYLLKKEELEQPELSAEEEFPGDLIEKTEDEASLEQAVGTIFDVRGVTGYRLGIFDRLKHFEHAVIDEGFGDVSEIDNPMRDQFLQYYKKVQPHLVKVDSQFDTHFFLRGLKTAKDFENGLRAVLNAEPKIRELIQAKQNEKSERVSRCLARIDILSEKLNDEEKTRNQQVEGFKSKVFDNYVEANVFSKLDVLGEFSKVFFNRIKEKVKAQKENILAELNLEQDIEKVVAERIDAVVSEAVRADAPIQSAYTGLTTTLTAIRNELKKEEANTAIDAFQQEKIDLLKEQEKVLMSVAGGAPDIAAQALHETNNKVIMALRQIKYLDSLRKLNSILFEMREHIESSSDSKLPENIAKLREIERLQQILYKENSSPAARFKEISTEGLKPQSKEILLQNSDSWFVSALKEFWSFLTGWQSYDQQKVSQMSKELTQLKTDADLGNQEGPPNLSSGG